MAIGKTKRFEIFKRDGFTCQYCGQRPPEVILEVDHITPVAGGGQDDDVNLITACFNCNRGKRDRKLENVGPKPDADLEYLKMQQEIVEAKRYLKAKAQCEKAFLSLIESLNGTWAAYLTDEYTPLERAWRTWLSKYAPDEIESAIKIAAGPYRAGRFGDNQLKACTELVKYVSGIMRNVREEKAEEEEAATRPLAKPTEYQVFEAFNEAFTVYLDFLGDKPKPPDWDTVKAFAAHIEKLYEDYKKRLEAEPDIPF